MLYFLIFVKFQDEDADLSDEIQAEKRAWNSGFAGGMGKRAWNSGFAGGMGKRAWNSNFNGGMGKRAWNSNFGGGMGKRAWNSFNGGYGKRALEISEGKDRYTLKTKEKTFVCVKKYHSMPIFLMALR